MRPEGNNNWNETLERFNWRKKVQEGSRVLCHVIILKVFVQHKHPDSGIWMKSKAFMNGSHSLRAFEQREFYSSRNSCWHWRHHMEGAEGCPPCVPNGLFITRSRPMHWTASNPIKSSSYHDGEDMLETHGLQTSAYMFMTSETSGMSWTVSIWPFDPWIYGGTSPPYRSGEFNNLNTSNTSNTTNTSKSARGGFTMIVQLGRC